LQVSNSTTRHIRVTINTTVVEHNINNTVKKVSAHAVNSSGSTLDEHV